MKKPIKIALHKGRLLADTASLLQEAGWGLNDYDAETRLYHLKSTCFPELSAKIFNEKDIPIQVAIGNYDLGICGLDWIAELLVKYPSSAVIKVKELDYGRGYLDIYAPRFAERSLADIVDSADLIRIASEYPNLAESYAARSRFRKFSVFSLWGAAEVYPPENAELVLITESTKRKNLNDELIPLRRVMKYNACIIANRMSWETKDMSHYLDGIPESKPAGTISLAPINETTTEKRKINWSDSDNITLALPDGHQQSPTIDLLNKAGIKVTNYVSSGGNRRPTTNIEGIMIKVIRPQDMPSQVANGNFDLAITGKDWLKNHLYQFPGSPVEEMLDLKYGWVRIVSVVSNSWPVNDTAGLRKYIRANDLSLRLASEYVNIADKYARDNHMGMYRIIPTWGATETFVPDDADVLIENTQTGKTLAKNNLKIIDVLFESTACLIGRIDATYSPLKKQRIKTITAKLSAALQES